MSPEALRARAVWLGLWRSLRRWHRYEVEGLEHLLQAGPCFLVGYHGRPIAHDLCMLQTVVLERTGRMPRAIVHDQLPTVPGFAALAEGAEFLAGSEESIAAAVAAGQQIIITPGGSREGCRSVRHRHEVNWGKRRGYARTAAALGVPIVPAAGVGTDNTYIGLNDGEALGARLGLPKGFPVWLGVGPFGLWPLSPPFPVKVTTRLGAPIPTAHVDPRDPVAIETLHDQVVRAVSELFRRPA